MRLTASAPLVSVLVLAATVAPAQHLVEGGAPTATAGNPGFPADPGSLGPVPDPPGKLCNTAGAPLDVTFTVSGLGGTLAEVSVDFTMSPAHAYVGLLHVELFAPDAGPSHVIFGRTAASTPNTCGDNSDVAGPYTFSDLAPDSPTWWEAAAAAGGTVPLPSTVYRTSTPGGGPGGGVNTLMSPVFEGLTDAETNGIWTLRFRNFGAGSTGTVSAATLFPIMGLPFGDGFETGDVSRWSSAQGVTQVLTLAPADALRLVLGSGRELAGAVAVAGAAGSDARELVAGLAGDGTVLFRIEARPTGEGDRFELRLAARDAAGGWARSAWAGAPADDGPCEVEWRRPSRGLADGALFLESNGTLLAWLDVGSGGDKELQQLRVTVARRSRLRLEDHR